jgi:serine kinase of HPr protein (carbohydrate metabolism regulator)
MKVGSDHDFRAKIIITFYQRFLPKDKTLMYVDRDAMQLHPPEWIITHGNNQPETLIQLSDSNAYRLVKSEMSSELSGFNWFLYRAAN